MSAEAVRMAEIGRTTTCDCYCHSVGDICAPCGQAKCDAFRRALAEWL